MLLWAFSAPLALWQITVPAKERQRKNEHVYDEWMCQASNQHNRRRAPRLDGAARRASSYNTHTAHTRAHYTTRVCAFCPLRPESAVPFSLSLSQLLFVPTNLLHSLFIPPPRPPLHTHPSGLFFWPGACTPPRLQHPPTYLCTNHSHNPSFVPTITFCVQGALLNLGRRPPPPLKKTPRARLYYRVLVCVCECACPTFEGTHRSPP